MYNIYPYISRKRSMRFKQLVGALIPNNKPLASIRIYTAGYVPFFRALFSYVDLAVRHKGALRPFQEHWLNSTAGENELQKELRQ